MDDEQRAAGALETEPSAYDEPSEPFVGRWNRLVSQTNWEKGRIILQWREALRESGAAPAQHSDEAWSRRVGQVSSQHVGRLRRVCERFGDVYQEYAGLYWSHFQAALDWDDAEMWLEGAVQNVWSVSQMRAARWETLGAPAASKPRDEEIVTAEFDEDAPREAETLPIRVGEVIEPEGASRPGQQPEQSAAAYDVAAPEPEPERQRPEPLGAFEDLDDLPDDVAEAFESFKLAILRHKQDGWQEITQRQMLTLLEALKRLAKAPPN